MRITGLEEHFAMAEVMDARKSVDSRWHDLATGASVMRTVHPPIVHNALDLGPSFGTERDPRLGTEAFDERRDQPKKAKNGLHSP